MIARRRKSNRPSVSKRHGIAVAGCLVLLSINAVANDATIESIAWLGGCWTATNGEAGSIEQWTSPAGGSMLGVSRVVRGGKTVAFEYMRIVENDTGALVFIASPSGQPTAEFTLARLDADEAVFENLEHDFPQRIIYRLIDNEQLLGRIEGMVDGQPHAVDFPMTRVDCGKQGD